MLALGALAPRSERIRHSDRVRRSDAVAGCFGVEFE
jgi:hypothetical protein